jgi:membrane-associated phospholipid phosphatase
MVPATRIPQEQVAIICQRVKYQITMVFQTAPNIALQANAPGLGVCMLLISLLGMPEFYLFIIPLILWCYNKTLGLRLIFLLSIGAAINAMCKLLFHSPRPYWVSPEVKAFASEPTFGVPSGAAQISVIFLGYIGAWFKQTRVWIVCIILIILVAIARIYLGVHFLTDILTGWLIALIILFLFLRYENSAAKWLLQKPISTRILLALGVSVTFIVLSQLAILSFGTWQVPVEWSTLAFAQTNVPIDPVSLRDTLMAAGLLFGAGVGATLSTEYIPYVVDGIKSRKAVRYILGIILLGLIWLALSSATKIPGLPGFGLTYFRAALVGLWITAGAPYLFCRLGLADKNKIPQ